MWHGLIAEFYELNAFIVQVQVPDLLILDEPLAGLGIILLTCPLFYFSLI
jgi:hypothetical protein